MSKRLTPLRWSVEKAASEFQIDRRTLTKRINAGDIGPGTDGKFSTEQICAAVFGDYRREQLREIRERATKLELENQCMRKERIPLDVVAEIDNEVYMAIAGILKSNVDRVLTREVINEIFEQFRNIPETLGWETQLESHG
jgi:phage terminase Nu1 subunit (DNA packaging protein)